MTTIVVSKKVKVLPPVRTCLPYSAISKPCAHATLNYDTLTGTEEVHLAKGKSDGQQGDPLEMMLIFNLTIHNLWGRVLEKFQETRVVVHRGVNGSKPCTQRRCRVGV